MRGTACDRPTELFQIVDDQMEVALVFVDVHQGIFGIFVHRTEILTQQEAAVVKVLHYTHHSKKKKKKKRKRKEKEKKPSAFLLTSSKTFNWEDYTDWTVPPVGLMRVVCRQIVLLLLSVPTLPGCSLLSPTPNIVLCRRHADTQTQDTTVSPVAYFSQ